MSLADHPARELTLAELQAVGRERFGDDPLDVRWVCPVCGDVAAIRDWPDDKRACAGQECIGRSVEGRGCNFAAYGLIPGPWSIVLPDGRVSRAFPLAEAAS